MAIFYFILVWWGLESIKLKKPFLLTSNKFTIQSNPLMQSHLIFYKKVNKPNWKPKNYKFISLAVFQQLRRR